MMALRPFVGGVYVGTGDGDTNDMPGLEPVIAVAVSEKVERPPAEQDPTGTLTVTVTVAPTIGINQCIPATKPDRIVAFIFFYT